MPYEIDMPEEGWKRHVQEIVCEWCGTLRVEEAFVHPELETQLGMTLEQFELEVHRNDYHTWNEDTKTWSR